jgi:hypothetical protein
MARGTHGLATKPSSCGSCGFDVPSELWYAFCLGAPSSPAEANFGYFCIHFWFDLHLQQCIQDNSFSSSIAFYSLIHRLTSSITMPQCHNTPSNTSMELSFYLPPSCRPFHFVQCAHGPRLTSKVYLLAHLSLLGSSNRAKLYRLHISCSV